MPLAIWEKNKVVSLSHVLGQKKWIIQYRSIKTLKENSDDSFYKLGFEKVTSITMAKAQTTKKWIKSECKKM